MGARRRFPAFLLSAACIAVYTILVGAGASVVRAAIMGTLSLFARQVGRRQDGLNSLVFVAALMSAGNPSVLGDAGFQLSFSATLGLVLYADRFHEAFVQQASRRLPASLVQHLAGLVGEYLLFTLAAQLTSLPVSIYHFQRLPLASPFANPLILPAQPPLMIAGGLAVIAGLIYAPVGKVLGLIAWPFAAFTIRVVELFARLPGSPFSTGKVGLGWLLLFYVILFTSPLLLPRLRRLGGALKPSLALLALGALAGVVWQAALLAPDGRLHVTFLDVGNGEAVLVRTPTGRSLLIDGGSSQARLSEGLGRRMPFWDRRLDLLVVAGLGMEQIGGLPPVVERFPPATVLWPAEQRSGGAAVQLSETLDRMNLPVRTAVAGEMLDLGEGASLKVLAAGKRGAVLLITWENFRLLLPVGLDFESL